MEGFNEGKHAAVRVGGSVHRCVSHDAEARWHDEQLLARAGDRGHRCSRLLRDSLTTVHLVDNVQGMSSAATLPQVEKTLPKSFKSKW